jgi:hypothetical protein
MATARKILKITALVVLTPLLLAGVGWVTLNAYWALQIERELAAIHAEGHPISLAELSIPAIPDSENGAAEYRRAFALLIFASIKKGFIG